MASVTATDREGDLDRFYADVAAADLQPLWTQTRNLMPDEPAPATRPWLWKWRDVRPLCERAGRLVPIERGGERRVLSLSNPGLGGLPFASSTLWGAFQYLGPGESAPAHRHSPGAIRFVIEGEGAWTTVDGDACDMRPGDLVLTPSWRWHDHRNASDRPMIWFDGLDMPTVIALDAVFFEPHPDAAQAVRGRNVSERTYGGRATIPAAARHPAPHSPLLVYRWRDTDASLAALAADSREPAATLRYVNPLTGEDALPTLGCKMTRLIEGRRTRPIRRVGSSVYVVFRGRGASIVDGVEFEWAAGDSFVVPSWAVVEHQAAETADLFAIDDRPLLERLALFRETQLDEPQKVRERFQPR
jgi:gentisate 1,2-dioxygenase